MILTSGLVKRGRIYYFRMAVPRHLTRRLRRAEVSVSLRTDNLSKAKRSAREISSWVELLFEELREMPDISFEDIDERIRAYFQTCLNDGEEKAMLLPSDPMSDVAAEVAYLRERVDQLRADLALAKFSPSLLSTATDLMPDGLSDKEAQASELFAYACRAVARANIEHARILASKLSGDYSGTMPTDPLFLGMAANGLPPLHGEAPPAPKKDPSFSEVMEEYLAHQKKSCVAKTYDATLKALTIAAGLFGPNRPLRQYDATAKKRLRDVLSRLPTNYEKLPAFKGMTAEQAAAANKDQPVIAYRTQKKHVDFLGAFLIWAHNEEIIPSVPGTKIKAVKPKSYSEKDARHSYSTSTLNALFQSPLYAGCLSASRRSTSGPKIIRDDYFWLPLIALFSGMRLGEIVQLQPCDVHQVEGVWVMEVRRDEEGKNQVKTESSLRKVPIHAKLIELGLLDYVKGREGQERIFIQIKPGNDGYMSHNFSKWWGRYMKIVGLASDKTTFHSFRHKFIDLMRDANVQSSVEYAIAGHEEGTVHSNYGSKPPFKLMKEELDKVVFDLPFDS